MDPAASSADDEVSARFRDAYDQSGVDRTLVRESLALTPAERLAALEATLASLDDLLTLRNPQVRR
jgi:hypothetical protein